MPNFKIVKNTTPSKTFRSQSICGAFDINPESLVETFEGGVELPEDWSIGCIYGNSGTGKTLISKELFGDYITQEKPYIGLSIVDDMPEAPMRDIEKMFTSVGFSSPPSWLKPYQVLSNGEKMRVDLARALLEKRDIVIFDEFTSVVDRNVAKVTSVAVSKAVRKQKKKFVAVSCHDDILEWLEPDWTFCTNTMTYTNTRGLLRRPSINVEIHQAKRDLWRVFKKYHYMSSDIHVSAKCFVSSINGDLTGFLAVLPFPHPIAKNINRVHRLVVLPDFQGIGIAKALLETVGQSYLANKKRFSITTSQPGLVQMLSKNKNWVLTKQGRSNTHAGKSINHTMAGSEHRLTTSWELIR